MARCKHRAGAHGSAPETGCARRCVHVEIFYMDVCTTIERLTLPRSAWGHRTAKEHPEGQQSDKGLCSVQLQQPQVRQLPAPVPCCKTCSPRCFLKNNPELSLSEALDSVPAQAINTSRLFRREVFLLLLHLPVSVPREAEHRLSAGTAPACMGSCRTAGPAWRGPQAVSPCPWVHSAPW